MAGGLCGVVSIKPDPGGVLNYSHMRLDGGCVVDVVIPWQGCVKPLTAVVLFKFS